METRQPIWFSYLQVLFRWRYFYIISVLGVGIVAAIVSLLLPKSYQSTATILPPLQSSGIEALIPEEIKGFLGGLGTANPEVTVYLAILNSRTMLEKLIDEFDLATVYKLKKPYVKEQLLDAVRKNVTIEYDGENPLSVTVINRDSVLAAKMANFIVSELDRMYQQMNNRQAFFNRQFLEKRVIETRVSLSSYEDSLRAFQEKYQAVSLTEQAKVSIGVAADLVAKMMDLDVQIQVLRASVQSDHPQLRTMIEEKKEIEHQITKLTKMSSEDPNAIVPLPGLNELPELGMLYLRLYREVEIQSKLLEFLIPQYEQARIQEVRDTPTVTVLDPGQVPTKRAKPKRKIIVLTAMILAFVVSSAYVFSAEFLSHLKAQNLETYQGLELMVQQFKKNIPFVRKT